MALVQVTHPGAYQYTFQSIIGASSLAESIAADRARTSFTADFGDGAFARITGSSFSFNKQNQPVGGFITSAEIFANGVSIFTITGLTTHVSELYSWAAAYQDTLNAPPSPIFAGDDTLKGGSGNDWFDFGEGHDVMFGGDGADQLIGGDGNDHIYGQSPNGGPDGNDNLIGGAGTDYLQGNAGADHINGDDGSDRIQGGQGDDTISGGAGNDSINGNLGNDEIHGGSDQDALRGGQGNDTLNGGQGADTVLGDKGDDILIGGAGLDLLVGGEGRDSFYIRAQPLSGPNGVSAIISAQFTKSGPEAYQIDVITDFRIGEDLIGIGTSLTGTIYQAQSASNVVEAVQFAEQLFRVNNANNTNAPGIALVGVGTDTYLFMRSYDESINVGVKILNVSVNDLANSPNSFEPSVGYYFE